MAYVVQWDVSFNSRPLSTEPLGNGYTEIQKTRSAIVERIANEHSFKLSDTLNTNQGKHLQGSARIFVSDTEPVVPSTPMADDGTFDSGRMLFKPTVKELLVRTASAWISILKMSADAIFNTLRAASATITGLLSAGSISASGTISTSTSISALSGTITTLTSTNSNTTNLDVSATPIKLASGVTGPTPVDMKFGQGTDYRFVRIITINNAAVGMMVGGLLVADSYGFDSPAKNDATIRGTLRLGESKVPARGITISTSDPSGGDEGNLWIKV